MDHDRTSSLTDAQRDCLRLVASGLEAKEIARALEISSHAVIERLRAARRQLGVSTSREAARLMLQAEQGATYNPFVTMPIGVVPPSPERHAQPRHQFDHEGVEPLSVADRQQVRFEPDYLKRPVGARMMPFPTAERQWNDLTSAQRLGWVLAIAVGIALMLGGLTTGSVSIIEALSRLF
ncbi:helix-turn-helix transcriptional regulator [Sphingomonas naphthae]|uniref:Helix-turn-helix transcriptional regulator n=1 Tax=Sphingomonas naphthae TaxID=1813468 RepID=A0ABY7TII8_9SPHN|nr:helix-turn-helix transcriptional regulator [Sphingomonas naphthae]WCT72537.1 helix-turn-helix transcriptional regulator [Sphingomonas naphthae]